MDFLTFFFSYPSFASMTIITIFRFYFSLQSPKRVITMTRVQVVFCSMKSTAKKIASIN